MFERVPFKREHLSEMLKQESNKLERAFFKTVDFDSLEKIPSFTGMVNGGPVFCGGLVPLWVGRAYLWAVFDENTKNCFVPIFRGIRQFLDEIRPMYNRLEIAVPCDFKTGIRRAKLLGFTIDCERAIRYLPDGRDCSLLVRLGGA